MRWLFVVLALAGCDKVLGLERPDALADGHDEDLDGLADDKDNCPTVKGSQADSDKDGVGDLCDPNEGIANRIGAFYAFDVMPPGWIPISGSWTVANDTLVHTAGDDFAKFVAKNGPPLTPPYVVEARFRFTTTPAGAEFSVVAAWDASANEGTFCSLINETMTEVHAYNIAGAGRTLVSPLDFTATFTARLIVDPPTITCIMHSDKQGDTAASGDPPTIPPGFIGLEGITADSTIDYVIVYTR
jgi:hypothetical protein